jgi:hypothetical protein
MGISLLKNNKALGNCNISPEVIKQLRSQPFCELILLLFNNITKLGMPDDWNTLDIVSLHKKGSIDDPNNFRGLSVMHTFAKLFAICVNSKL